MAYEIRQSGDYVIQQTIKTEYTGGLIGLDREAYRQYMEGAYND